MRATGTTGKFFPWIIIGLGFVAALDALGAALDRGAKSEGFIRFFFINASFSGIGIWLLHR